MEEIKIYELFLKLNTYLNRQNHLANKMLEQEQELGKRFVFAKTSLPPEVFISIFEPMIEILKTRINTMNEVKEASNGLAESVLEFGNLYKGTVQ